MEPVFVTPVLVPVAANSKSGSNAAATITLAAVADYRHVLVWLCWSYSADPTGGRVTVASGGSTLFDFDVIKGGPGAMIMPEIPFGLAAAVTITIAAGGSGITGKLNVYTRMTPFLHGLSNAT